MARTVILLLVACVVTAEVEEGSTEVSCPLRCPKVLLPACGMRLESGIWQKQWFANECEMKDANQCEGGNYIKCTDFDPNEGCY